MPSPAVTSTKVAAPRPPGRYLSRSRLIDHLDHSVEAGRGVVLVSAPAGAGKSTLVNGWLGGSGRASGWLQIDEGDDDPQRFWAYVAAALAEPMPSLTEVVASAAGSGLAAVVTAVVNELAELEDGLVLVLDDYHLVSNPDVHTSVERLVTLRPPNLTVVLSTRVDPPFRLGRLRVRDALTEIRADDLRFDADEAAHLLDAAAVGLDASAVERLRERTEGWAAGLVLAGLSLRSSGDVDGFVTSFHGDDQLVADYLSDEFLDSLGVAERDRLLEVSVLERMSGPLVDEITGSDDGTAWLRSLAATNQLVIALDRTGTWFRFHHLLRDVLRDELAHRAPERRAELHAAAGRWHAEVGEPIAAIDHHLAAGCDVEAADLVTLHATELLNVGRAYTVARYLDRLAHLLGEHGGLALVRSWMAFMTGRFHEAETSLAVVERLGGDGVDAGLVQALRAMLHIGEGDVASALAVVRADDAPTVDAGHPMTLGSVRVMAGHLDEARPFLTRAKEMAASQPDHFAAAITRVYEAVGELDAGHLVVARELAAEAIELAADHALSEAAQLAMAHSVMARTSVDPDEAVRAAQRGVELARRSPEALVLAFALASAADAAFLHADDEAEALLVEARSVVDRCRDPGIAGRYLRQVEARHGQADRVAVDGLVEEITERELSVLRYLPSKLSQREIAVELYVSLNTVKTHCKAIYRKLGVDGRQAAVQAARDHDLL
ncbi:MAG: LuxR C-terminal-related transcriptional regulator [Actinomycetota bacterium]